MLQKILTWILRRIGFRCGACGQLTFEKNRNGDFRCLACFEAEIRTGGSDES